MDAYSDPTRIATAEQFKAALLAVRDEVPDMMPYSAMLRAHCRAPKHTISSAQLAKELGYASHASANMQYGTLAHLVCDALHCTLPPTPSGDPHWWRTLAYGNHGKPVTDDGHYEWTMRPELVQALQEMKWA